MPRGIYLLSHSVGCLPQGSARIMEQRYFEPWQRAGGDAWADWLAEITRFREAVATVIGGDADAVCPQTNVSSAFAKILHGLPAEPHRRRILLCEEDFPSLGFVAAMAQQAGFEAIFMPRAQDPLQIENWERRLDESCRIALVTHAFSNRSARLPVREITALCRERGIVSVVDVAQTVGAVPIDVNSWSADFVIGSCVKFLCGGPGAGFLWATQAAIEASQPRDVGWFSHDDPFEFDIHRFRYAADARRFWGGTPSIAPFVQAAYSIETLLGIGLAHIHAHNQALIGQLLDAMPAARVASEPHPQRRGNTVLLRVADAARTLEALRGAHISSDLREGCLRVSPHIYNDPADIEALVRVVVDGTGIEPVTPAV